MATMTCWRCVVERDQVYRHGLSGVLYEVKSVVPLAFDATVHLRPVDMTTGHDDVPVRASAMCGGSDYERLPDDDGETILWGGGTCVGVG